MGFFSHLDEHIPLPLWHTHLQGETGGPHAVAVLVEVGIARVVIPGLSESFIGGSSGS